MLLVIRGQSFLAPSTLSRSTSNPPLKSTDFLQEVDLKVKEIMKKVQSRQKEMGGDCGVVINECGVEVALSSPLRWIDCTLVQFKLNTTADLHVI